MSYHFKGALVWG